MCLQRLYDVMPITSNLYDTYYLQRLYDMIPITSNLYLQHLHLYNLAIFLQHFVYYVYPMYYMLCVPINNHMYYARPGSTHAPLPSTQDPLSQSRQTLTAVTSYSSGLL